MSRLSDEQKQLEKLRREHTKLDARLQELESHKWLTPDEEAEIKRLKREKLARKDQMRLAGSA